MCLRTIRNLRQEWLAANHAWWLVTGELLAEFAAQARAEFSSGEEQSARLGPVPHFRRSPGNSIPISQWTWLQHYLRIDTTNPPGNEMRAVRFYKKILDPEGIENRVFEYAPGRGDLWARLPHTKQCKRQRPIVLLNHMDVVTSDAAHWTFPPFSGEIKDGYLWGRGAQDMKDEGLAQLVVMVMLKREKVALDRDVIFLAVSDEEVDGTGTRLVHRASAGPAG